MDASLKRMKRIHVSAPINIALIKYWGKEDPQKLIPYNGSLSLTLSDLRTHTILSLSNTFEFVLNDTLQSSEEHDKLRRFMRHFIDDATIDQLRVESTNDAPTAAGVASSASGYAALSLALKTWFTPKMDQDSFHHITRLGSGSACRSLYGGAVVWEKDGSVYSIREQLPNYKMLVLLLNQDKKKFSSREAMRLTVETSPYYRAWVHQATQDLELMKQAIQTDDFKQIGSLMERNFLAMHASMMASTPPVHYINDQSWHVLDSLRHARQHEGLDVYATMDAGPNVKLLYRTQDEERLTTWIQTHFPYPMLSSRIAEGAQVHAFD